MGKFEELAGFKSFSVCRKSPLPMGLMPEKGKKTNAKKPMVTCQRCLMQTILVYSYMPTTFAYHPHHMVLNHVRMKLARKKTVNVCFPHVRTNPDCFEEKHPAVCMYIYIHMHIDIDI